jgi:hypothetical protein
MKTDKRNYFLKRAPLGWQIFIKINNKRVYPLFSKYSDAKMTLRILNKDWI